MNAQQKLEQIISATGGAPRLLLHSCCAPCSSYVLEYLSPFFTITVFYYNPNIYPADELKRRADEQKRLIDLLPCVNPVSLVIPDNDSAAFYEAAQGLEGCLEGGERCRRCFELRLRETARAAKEGGYSAFMTTLTVSPHKNADLINAIGLAAGKDAGVSYIESDFKKKNGYLRSLALSREYDLYRQGYCGCRFSAANPALNE